MTLEMPSRTPTLGRDEAEPAASPSIIQRPSSVLVRRELPIARLLALALALLFGLAGQYYFTNQRDFFWDGVTLYVVAVICFLLALRRPSQAAETESIAVESGWTVLQIARGVMVVTALALAALAILQVQAIGGDNTQVPAYWRPFWFWIGSCVLFLAAYGPWTEPAWQMRGSEGVLARLGQRLIARQVEIACLFALLVLAWILRYYHVAVIPQTMGGDEGTQGVQGVLVLKNQLTNMFVTGWLGVPTLSFFFQALAFKLDGISAFSLRIPWVIVGTVTVGLFWLWARRLFGATLAWMGSFLLATYHYHIHFSRLGSNQVADPFFMLIALIPMLRGYTSRKRLDWAVAGMAVGVSFYFYAGARLVAAVLLLLLIYEAVKDNNFLREQWSNMLVMALGAAVGGGPLLLYFIRHPQDFNSRLNAVGIFESGWLTREIQITQRSALDLVLQQFKHSFFVFNYYYDRVSWYQLDAPLLGFVAGILFVFGLVYTMTRLRTRAYFILAVWFWAGLILGGTLTENPPSSQRLVTLAAPVCLMVAIGLVKLLDILRAALTVTEVREKTESDSQFSALSSQPSAPEIVVRPLLGRVEYGVLLSAVVLYMAVQSVNFYFNEYTPRWIYGSANAEVATQMGYYLAGLGIDYRFYFAGTPRMFHDFGTIPFLARQGLDEVQGMDIDKPLTGPPTFVTKDKNAVFIFLPERQSDLQVVQKQYPRGHTLQIHRPVPNGPLLFWAYEVPKEQL